MIKKKQAETESNEDGDSLVGRQNGDIRLPALDGLQLLNGPQPSEWGLQLRYTSLSS